MRYVIGAIALVFLLSCEERFIFDTEENSETRIVINGFINQSTGPYFVYISQTQNSGAPRPIVGATVILMDQENNTSSFKEIDRGIYRNDNKEIVGQPGWSYSIDVTLLSGERYQSEPDTIPLLSVEYDMTWNEYLKPFTSDLGGDFNLPVVGINLDVNISSNNDPIFLNWLGEELYQFVPTDFPDPFGSIPPPCYVTQQIGTEQVNLFSNIGFGGDQLRVKDIFWREIDDTFLRKHIFSIYQYSISERYYNYLKGVESLVENAGSLFDTPPGQVVGNFKTIEGMTKKPLGFFSAYISDTVRVAVYPSELETFIYEECLYRGGFNRDYDRLCVDCLLLPRSTFHKPDFWIKY